MLDEELKWKWWFYVLVNLKFGFFLMITIKVCRIFKCWSFFRENVVYEVVISGGEIFIRIEGYIFLLIKGR